VSFAIIDGESIRSAIDLASARKAVRTALVASAKGALVAPDEMAMRFEHGGELHVKGAHLHGSRWIAFKVATGGFPHGGNSGGTMVLDAEHGTPRFFLEDGGWLTEIRTAAAGALATRALAVDPVCRIAIVGTGIQARYQLEAHRDAIPDATFVVWGRTAEHAQAFADQNEMDCAESLSLALEKADAVVTTTSARSPVVTIEHIRPGLHITAMGSDTPDKQEIDAEVLRRCELVAADDVTVTRRVGELHHAPDVHDRAINLGAILSGEHPGRAAHEALTLCDLSGIGAEDAAMAELVLDRLDLDRLSVAPS